jgi:ribose 5-phosphate isomerase RpiB
MATDDELRALAKTIWDCSADRTDVEDILLRALAGYTKRIEAERIKALEAENERLRKALSEVKRMVGSQECGALYTDDAAGWSMAGNDIENTVSAALANKDDADRQRAERNAHVKAQIERIHSYMPDAEERN